jgi:hypothetical protein
MTKQLFLSLTHSASSHSGISPAGEWSIGAGNITLYKNDLFMGFFDMSGTIVVGGDTSTCPDAKLNGPSATVNVVLIPDSGQEGISLGYQNLCTKVKTTIWDGSIATEGVTDYVFPLVLSAGEYEFLITGNGKSIFFFFTALQCHSPH